ncbi:1122_t:CDS:2, partial [Rhizophagus irregularis]
ISSQPLYPKSDDIKPSPISYSTPKILPTSLNLQSSQSSHLNIPNNNDSKNDLTINPKNNATLTNKGNVYLVQLRRDKEQNKIDNTRVDHIKIPVVKSLPSWQKRFISLSSPSIPKLITNNQQVIQQLKLTHGLFINGYNIQPSEQAIVTEKGKLDMSLYNGQPIVYTNINDPVLSVNLLNFNSDENNFIINTLQPSDLCINFPIAEITYNTICGFFAIERIINTRSVKYANKFKTFS